MVLDLVCRWRSEAVHVGVRRDLLVGGPLLWALCMYAWRHAEHVAQALTAEATVAAKVETWAETVVHSRIVRVLEKLPEAHLLRCCEKGFARTGRVRRLQIVLPEGICGTVSNIVAAFSATRTAKRIWRANRLRHDHGRRQGHRMSTL